MISEQTLKEYVREMSPASQEAQMARFKRMMKQMMERFEIFFELHQATEDFGKFFHFNMEIEDPRVSQELYDFHRQQVNFHNTEILHDTEKARALRKREHLDFPDEYSICHSNGKVGYFYSGVVDNEVDKKRRTELADLMDQRRLTDAEANEFIAISRKHARRSQSFTFDKKDEYNKRWDAFVKQRYREQFERYLLPSFEAMHDRETQYKIVYFKCVKMSQITKRKYRELNGGFALGSLNLQIDFFYMKHKSLKNLQKSDPTFGQTAKMFFKEIMAP